jgi:glycerol-3-phosphate dehydrogenase
MNDPRGSALERLAHEAFDLLVIGAGVTGARIAYDASRAGMRVALVDAGDVAGGTSSASSKLLHGGFRYLAQRSYRLVHDAGSERYVLATRVASHLSHPLPVVLTMERGRWPEWQLRYGLMLYFGLSGFKPPRPRLLDPDEARAIAPELQTAEERIHVLLPEFQTDDSRLVLATALGAAAAGAVVAPYVEVVGLPGGSGRVDRIELVDTLGGERIEVRARGIVNASGPWIDRVRALEEPGCAPIARLSKGVHVTLPLSPGWSALVAFYSTDDRTSFAAPWQGTLLVGTTDTEYNGDPSLAGVDDDDVTEVLAGVAQLLPPERVERSRILSSWAGLRVRPRGEDDTRIASREHLLSVGPRGVVSIAGGKLTTHRRMSADALELLPPELRPRRLGSSTAPLPGSARSLDGAGLVAAAGEDVARHLRSVYGSEADGLAAYADRPGAFDRIHPDGPDVWAQVAHAVEHELACTVDDVVWRRTSLAHRGLADEGVRAAVAARMSESQKPVPMA